MKLSNNKKTISKISKIYNKYVHKYLTKKEIKKAIKIQNEYNKKGYSDCCSLHEFCDANEIIYEALQELNIEINFDNDYLMTIINNAIENSIINNYK